MNTIRFSGLYGIVRQSFDEYEVKFWDQYKNDENKDIYTFCRLNNDQSYVEFFKEYKEKRSFVSELPRYGSLMKAYVSCLSGLSMSPLKAELHKKFYYLPPLSEDDRITEETRPINVVMNDQSIPINRSKRRIELFFEYLVDKSKEVLTQAEDCEGDRFIIVGPPGIGKTSLINYIFSTNQDIMDKESILHIRVDLNNLMQKTDKDSLKDKLFAKMLMLFSKYYFMSSDAVECEGGSNLQHKMFLNIEYLKYYFGKYINDELVACKKIKEHFSVTKKQSDETIEQLVCIFLRVLCFISSMNFQENKLSLYVLANKFIEQYGEELPIINTEFADNYLSKINTFKSFLRDFSVMLMGFLQSKGIRYIIIFDGLDSVTFETVQYEQYTSWLHDIKRLTSNPDNIFYKAVYLVTMRDYSYMRFYRDERPTETIQIDKFFIPLSIAPADGVTLIRKKIEYVKYSMIKQGIFTNDQSGIVENMLANIVYFVVHCFSFLQEYQLMYVIEKDSLVLNKFLKSLFGNNHRLMFACLKDSLLVLCSVGKDDFIKNLSNFSRINFIERYNRLDWYVHRHFITGTPYTDLFTNQYDYSKEGEPERKPVFPVILNVFNFNEYSQCTKYATKDCFRLMPKSLVKLRIISYLQRKEKKQDYLDNIFRWLKENFCKNWDEELLFESRELIFHDILGCDVNDEIINNSQRYVVRLTDKTEMLLNMLDTSVYYETVLDDTPILSRYCCEFAPLHWGEIRKIGLSKYLILKTKYILKFIAYLLALERGEYYSLPTSLKDRYNENGLAIFEEERIEKILKSVTVYLTKGCDNLTDKEYNNFFSDLKLELLNAEKK